MNLLLRGHKRFTNRRGGSRKPHLFPFRNVAASDGHAPLSIIAGVQDGLRELATRVRAATWRSNRFSWFAWGFLFAVAASEALIVLFLLLFPVVTTTTTSLGSSSTTTVPFWALPVALTPAVLTLGLAIRELLLARREAQGAPLSRFAPRPDAEELADPGWTLLVQKAQQRITQAKSETDWSFVPILLGGLGFAELVIGNAVLVFGLFSNLSIPLIFIIPATAAVSLVLFWPLYRVARRWIRGYQTLLDRQVGDLSQLESDFLWRFVGTQTAP